MEIGKNQEAPFDRAIAEGTDSAFAEWLATGPECVTRLEEELNGSRKAQVPAHRDPRLFFDNLSGAAFWAAKKYPGEFLRVFADPQWDDNTFVCCGLGAIHSPEATERLLRLLSHRDKWVRMQAAVGLAGHRHPGLATALAQARSDPDYLVRYHVEKRLAELRAEES